MARIDQKSAANRFATQQHSKSHRIARRERQLDGPLLAEQADLRQHDRPARFVPARTLHVAVFQQLGLRREFAPRGALKRVNLKPHVGDAAIVKGFKIERVQRRRARSRVDLGLDGRNM